MGLSNELSTLSGIKFTKFSSRFPDGQVLKSLGMEEDVIRLLTFRPSEDRG